MKKFEWKTVKQRMGKGKKKIIAVTVVLCLVAATTGGVISEKNKSNASNNKVISTNVRTGTIKESVSGTGTISYASTTDIEIPSELEIDEVMVSEGSYVEQGALLATVDETSLAVCIADVEEEIESLDSTISSELSSTTTKYITAGVSGTVEKIYGEVGDDVTDVMVEYGALMLVKNGDETIKVVGSDGTITAVNVSEGGTVSASSKIFTLESDAQSGDYLQAVKDREELVSILETLLSIKKNGGITASIEGMVETVNVIGTSKESSTDSKDSASVEESESLTSSDSASVEENETSSSSDSASVEESESLTTSDSASVEESESLTSSDSASVEESESSVSSDSASVEEAETVASSDEVHKIAAVTMTNLSSVSVSEFGTAAATTDKMKVLEELKAGAGRIEGTTKDMEYADSLEAEEWTECTDEYTEVNTGKWYVRYKATESEAASEAVEIEVTEKASAGSENSIGSGSSDNSSGSSSSSGKSSSSSNTTSDSSSGSSNTGSSKTDSSNSNSGSSNSNLTSGKSGSSNSNSSDSSSIAGSNTGSSNTDSGSSSSKNSTSSGSGSSSGKSSTSSGSGSASEKSSGGSGSSSSSKSGSSGSSSSSKSSSSGGSSGSSSGGAGSSSSSLVSTTAAFTIANGDKMKVTVNVDELDILTMEEGLEAEITLDAVENKTFTGTITYVSGSASGSNGSTQYPVEITFDRTEEMLSGMNASVAVIIEEAADVLTIPLVAVTDEGRTSYVYTSYDEATGELSGKTEVTLGMSDENSVEVKVGLSEGDTVYYEMQESDSSDSSKSGRSGMGGMGIPGMGSSSDMKMGGDRPSGSNGGERPSGSGNGDRPSGGNGGDRSSGSSGSKSKGN